MNIKGKVLIADDEDAIRLLIASALKLDGWETIEAKNGQEALEIIMSCQLDVVLLDHRMPVMTGSEVCQHICNRGVTCKVVLMTAATNIKELAQNYMFTNYLAKPFSIDQLRIMVKQTFALVQ